MSKKLKKSIGILAGLVGFIASVTGIAGWLGFTLQLGGVLNVPNPVIIVVAALIASLLLVCFFQLGGVAATLAVKNFFHVFSHPEREDIPLLPHRREYIRTFSSLMKEYFRRLIGVLAGLIGFIASVIGIASWLGFTLHLGKVYVPNQIIFIVAIFITLLLSLGVAYFSARRTAIILFEFYVWYITRDFDRFVHLFIDFFHRRLLRKAGLHQEGEETRQLVIDLIVALEADRASFSSDRKDEQHSQEK